MSLDLDLGPGATVDRDVTLPAAKARAVVSAKETTPAPHGGGGAETPALALPKLRTETAPALPKLRVETGPK